MSDFEGARGMFAFLAVGPIGGSPRWWAPHGGCSVAGGRRSDRARRSVGSRRCSWASPGFVAAGIGLRIATIDTYTNELPPALEFEIRLPAAWTLEPRDAVRVELHTDRNMGDGTLFSPWPRPDGDRQLLVGSVDLAFKTSARILVLELPGQPTRLFRLPLSRNPSSTAGARRVAAAGARPSAGREQPEAAPTDDPVAVRYRVRRAGED